MQRKLLKPLGSHTAVGHLHELKKWKELPYLRDNNGMLPPFIIAVGSRVRVMKAREILNFDDPVFIDQEALGRVGINAFGRVSVLVGVSEIGDYPVPLLVIETQMGCPATQIILREAMYYAREDGYVFSGTEVRSDGIYVTRVGTCAGVNSHASSEPRISIGDILIANETYGSIGSVIQSAIGEINFTGICVAERVDEMRKILLTKKAIRLSDDLHSILTKSMPRSVTNLQMAARDLGLPVMIGANFSKDSLYAEIGEEGFVRMRDVYGVLSTEMEQQQIDVLAAEFREAGVAAYSGLVSAVIGAIPGKSFPETKAERNAAAQAEENAIKIAAKAFSNIARELNG
ncbi:hypothetical protein KKB44_01005 [Candidatus Micrarchaeota archaeon]|nr:hypothetical protein [Candidatus Micrarchaeota archaeon]